MRLLLAVLVTALFGCAATVHVQAQGAVGPGAPQPDGARTWIGGAPAQTRIHVGSGSDVMVGVWIEAPDVKPTTARAPMALALLVDTSGSMAGDKIANARMAASSMLETLRDGDIVSLYAFSSGVMQIAGPTPVDATSRRMLLGSVNALQPGGGTNLWDGLRASIQALRMSPPSHPVRRVVVVSDGLANIGPSDPMSLGNLAAGATEWGGQVTAIGVGLDYDERTLAALAIRSAGRMYHLADPRQMAHILNQEIGLLTRTIATNALIEIVPAPGVVILEGLSFGAQLDHGRLRVPVGALYGNERREVLFRARVDAAQTGRHDLATATLQYQDAARQAVHEQRSPIGYEVTPDANAAQRSTHAKVAAMVAAHEAARAQLQAATALNQGQSQDAIATLSAAEERLRRSAAAAPPAARARMMKQAEHMRQSQDSARSGAGGRATALEVQDSAMKAMGY